MTNWGSVAGDEPLASVDGCICGRSQVVVPAYDDGLLRGDGAFEFARVYLGVPFTLDEHLDRMTRTCATLRLAFPREAFEQEIAALLAAAGPVSTDLRIVLTRGGRRLIFLEPFLEWRPARLALVEDQPRAILAGAKSLSYAGNMLAKRIARERGFGEALFVTPEGHVTEVQQAAFFWVDRRGVLCTPPLSEGVLDSITRRVLMRQMAVTERPCTIEEALSAREALLAGSAREIQAVGVIEERVFAGAPGPVTRAADEAYWREVEAATGVSRGDHEAWLADSKSRRSAAPQS